MSRLWSYSLILVALVWTCAAMADEVTLEVLDVGQGDSLLLRNEEGKLVLIDAGDRKEDVKKLLQARGITRLDMVVATHPHADHIGGMKEVLMNFEVGLYIDSGLPHTSGTYTAVMEAVESKGIQYRTAKTGQTYNFGDGATFEVLWPGETLLTGTRSDLNSNSVVLRFQNGDDCFLFTGDAEEPTEHQIVSDGLAQCDVLKVAHHGGNHSSSDAFLNKLQPKIALISAGTGNSYGHPGVETMGRLSSRNIEIFRTDTMGTLRVVSTGEGVKVTTERSGEALIAAGGGEGTSGGHSEEVMDTAEASEGVLDINTASAADFMKLPGIGQGKADAIVAFRDANGPFATVDDLRKVKGIGPATLEKFRAQITVGGGGAAAPAPKPDTATEHTSDPLPVAPPPSAGGLLNINTASAADLMNLPGIGQGKADAIIAHREANGPFASVDGLTKVKGIGPATLNKFRDQITVSGGGAAPVKPTPEPADTTPKPTPDTPPTPPPASAGGLVNINTADATQLGKLPGIGPGKASAIIEYRNQNGPFADCNGLTKVKGIGPATFQKLSAMCTVN